MAVSCSVSTSTQYATHHLNTLILVVRVGHFNLPALQGSGTALGLELVVGSLQLRQKILEEVANVWPKLALVEFHLGLLSLASPQIYAAVPATRLPQACLGHRLVALVVFAVVLARALGTRLFARLGEFAVAVGGGVAGRGRFSGGAGGCDESHLLVLRGGAGCILGWVGHGYCRWLEFLECRRGRGRSDVQFWCVVVAKLRGKNSACTHFKMFRCKVWAAPSRFTAYVTPGPSARRTSRCAPRVTLLCRHMLEQP